MEKMIKTQVEIRKANANDQEAIVALLEKFYPGVPNHWRKLFAPRAWQVEDDFPGFIIVDNNKVVGFLGTIFSEHNAAQGKERICNLTTWYVEPAYRQHGMALFLKVMKLPNVSWSNLTAAPHTHEWLIRSGFKMLQDTQTTVLPLPKLFHKKNATVTLNFSEKDLNIQNQAIYRAHQNLHCRHVLIKKNNAECYCLLVITKYKKVPLAKIYYMSDTNLFREVLADIRFQLCWKLGVFYLNIEGNYLEGNKLYGAWIKKLFPPRLFKSNTLTREEMPTLCSEFFILGI